MNIRQVSCKEDTLWKAQRTDMQSGLPHRLQDCKAPDTKRISEVCPSQGSLWTVQPLMAGQAAPLHVDTVNAVRGASVHCLLRILGLTFSTVQTDSWGQLHRPLLWILGCLCHKAQSLREVTNRITATTTIKKNLPAARLSDGQFLGQVIKPRYVVNAVLVHHAHQLGIHHL